jgi:iron complex transport system ATP-binding protein
MNSVLLKDLSIGYGQKDDTKVVASRLNASINSGELTCLLGQNGIGKSTLLRTLAAFQPALAGDVLMATTGSNATTTDDSQRMTAIATLTDRQLSRMIGIVLTEKPDVRNMTVTELVGLGRSPYTGFWGTLNSDDRQVVSEAIHLVGIEPLKDRMVHTLSDGERQKVMIAKALAQQTPVIYLDEPTAFLDFPSKVDMLQLLRRLAHEEQKTILLSTHDVELAVQLADSIWLMEPGTLTVGSPRQLADDGTLACFIERPGITFDRQTLVIRVAHTTAAHPQPLPKGGEC